MKKIILSGVVGWEMTIDSIREELNSAGGADLDINIASPGGSVMDGIEIFNLFRDYKREYPESQIIATIKGLAASMATYIALNPAFDLIAAEDNAVFMIHNVWGMTVGDYKELRKTADIFESLTKLIADVYIKKTKKSKSEIREMMDEETWLFGDEILKAGFVDEIIKTDSKKNKASNILDMQHMFLEKAQNFNNEKLDINKIAAMIKPDINNKPDDIPNKPRIEQKPASAGKNKTEVNSMTLQEFLNENPAAKAEYDNNILKIRNEQFEAGKKFMQDSITQAAAFLGPDNKYPAPIKSLAVSVLKGEKSSEALLTTVAAFDALKESQNSENAQDETTEQGDVPVQNNSNGAKDGLVNNEQDFISEVRRFKETHGLEVN